MLMKPFCIPNSFILLKNRSMHIKEGLKLFLECLEIILINFRQTLLNDRLVPMSKFCHFKSLDLFLKIFRITNLKVFCEFIWPVFVGFDEFDETLKFFSSFSKSHFSIWKSGVEVDSNLFYMIVCLLVYEVYVENENNQLEAFFDVVPGALFDDGFVYLMG